MPRDCYRAVNFRLPAVQTRSLTAPAHSYLVLTVSIPPGTHASVATSPFHVHQRAADWPTLIGLTTAFGGAVILAGWAFNLPVVRSGIPGHAATRPTAAVAFILAGVSRSVRWGCTGSSSTSIRPTTRPELA